MKKFKSLITGIVIGAMLSGVSSYAYTMLQAYDKTGEHKLIINNKEVDMQEYKLLNYNDRSYVPLRLVAEQLGKEVDFKDLGNGKGEIYIGKHQEQQKSIVLMFHDIVVNDKLADNPYKVSLAYMEKVLKTIKNKGLTTGFIGQPADVYITLDDGYKSNYTMLYPLLQKYNMKATIFTCSKHMYYGEHGSNHFTYQEAREMVASGLVDIQAHTTKHYKLTNLSDAQIKQDILQVKKDFEDNGLKAPNKFAYPYGAYNTRVKKIVDSYYQYVVTSNESIFDEESNKLIPRYNIPNNKNINSLLNTLN